MLANIGLFELQPVEIIDTEIELFPEQIIPPSVPELAEETTQPGPSTDLQTRNLFCHPALKDSRQWKRMNFSSFRIISISPNQQNRKQNGEHLTDINRDFDIVKDNEFRQSNVILDSTLKMMVATGLSRPTKHKDIIELEDLRLISTYIFNDIKDPVLLRLKLSTAPTSTTLCLDSGSVQQNVIPSSQNTANLTSTLNTNNADVITVQEATDQIDREDTSDKDYQDGSTLPDTSGDTETDTEVHKTAQDNTQQQPARLRRRRILPTPPRELSSRSKIRKPPAYLKDYITKQAIGQTSWLQKVEWLIKQLKEGE
ncbi:unnamed protein product [Mytilus coruscus]|uniref:Uncharacterized protein n=1 Tax=Mytilus coruscus TaxID=42192 RepID=A0A6J8ER73_MYTCO|nr:unnamed protein product [Mytilus coruscus]